MYAGCQTPSPLGNHSNSIMLTRRGIAVSPGVVSGPAMVLGAEDFRIPQRFVRVDVVETEVSRFHVALDAACDELAENENIATEQLGRQYGAIFSAHQQLLKDPKLLEEIDTLIREKCYSPEYASSRVLKTACPRLSQSRESLPRRTSQRFIRPRKTSAQAIAR